MSKLGVWTAGGYALWALLGAASAGCSRGSDCEVQLNCETGAGGSGGQSNTGGQTGTAGSSGGAGGSGSTTTTPEPDFCGNDPTVEGSVVNDCGVFLLAGATGGDGTREKPVGSFAEAAQQIAMVRRIFACTGPVDETATVELSGTQVIGGFESCAENEWTWADANKNTVLRGPADKIALRLTGGENGLNHLDVEAAPAAEMGASSIAVVVDGTGGETTLAVKSGKLKSGAAMEGSPGDRGRSTRGCMERPV